MPLGTVSSFRIPSAYLARPTNTNIADANQKKLAANSAQEKKKLAEKYYKKGLIYLDNEDYDNAVLAFNSAIKNDPGNADYHNGLGLAYYERGSSAYYDFAIAAFNEAIKLNPNNADFHNNLGHAYSSKKDYTLAIDAFKKFIQNTTNNSDNYLILASTYRYLYLLYNSIESPAEAKKMLDKSVDLCNKIISSDKRADSTADKSGIFNLLGLVYYANKNYGAAEDAFKKSTEYDPYNVNSYDWLGRTYRENGESTKADEAFDKAIELLNKKIQEPISNKSHLYNNLGWIYFHKENYGKAIEAFRDSIKLMPNNPWLYCNLGDAYYEKGDSNLAIEAYKKALELNPKCTAAYISLIEIYAENGNHSEALEYLKQANENGLSPYLKKAVWDKLKQPAR